jgi:hypothetical protein
MQQPLIVSFSEARELLRMNHEEFFVFFNQHHCTLHQDHLTQTTKVELPYHWKRWIKKPQSDSEIHEWEYSLQQVADEFEVSLADVYAMLDSRDSKLKVIPHVRPIRISANSVRAQKAFMSAKAVVTK